MSNHKTLENLMRIAKQVLGGDKQPNALETPSLCSCGTKQDAIEAAHKTLLQMVEHDCLAWALQVNAAMSVFLLGTLIVRDDKNADLMMTNIQTIMTDALMKEDGNLDLQTEIIMKAYRINPEEVSQ